MNQYKVIRVVNDLNESGWVAVKIKKNGSLRYLTLLDRWTRFLSWGYVSHWKEGRERDLKKKLDSSTASWRLDV